MEATVLVEKLFGMVCTGFGDSDHEENAENARNLPYLLPHGLEGVSTCFRIYFDRTAAIKSDTCDYQNSLSTLTNLWCLASHILESYASKTSH